MGRHQKVYEWKGDALTGRQWADRLGIRPKTFKTRLTRYGRSARTFEPHRNERSVQVLKHDGEELTVAEWASRLGLGESTIRDRLHRFGPNDPRVFEPHTNRARVITHNGESRTLVEWAHHLGITLAAFKTRLYRFGVDDPGTFQPRKKRRSPSRALENVTIANDRTPMTFEDREERMDFIQQVVAEFPQVRENTPEGLAIVQMIVETLGRMSNVEIAVILGVSRERVRQIESIALKKMKLRGGHELRRAYEDKATLPIAYAWDEIFIGKGCNV